MSNTASGFSTSSDGSWSAYYGLNGRASKCETETEAIIAAHKWLDAQKAFERTRAAQQALQEPVEA